MSAAGSVNFADWQYRQRAMKEEERRKKTQTTEMLQQYRGGVNEEDLKLSALKSEERKKLQDAERLMRSYQGKVSEDDLKLSAMKSEERKKLQDAERLMRSYKCKSVEVQKKERPPKPDQNAPPVTPRTAEDMRSMINAGYVKEKKGNFDSATSHTFTPYPEGHSSSFRGSDSFKMHGDRSYSSMPLHEEYSESHNGEKEEEKKETEVEQHEEYSESHNGEKEEEKKETEGEQQIIIQENAPAVVAFDAPVKKNDDDGDNQNFDVQASASQPALALSESSDDSQVEDADIVAPDFDNNSIGQSADGIASVAVGQQTLGESSSMFDAFFDAVEKTSDDVVSNQVEATIDTTEAHDSKPSALDKFTTTKKLGDQDNEHEKDSRETTSQTDGAGSQEMTFDESHHEFIGTIEDFDVPEGCAPQTDIWPSAVIRLDVNFSFGLITTSDKPVLKGYLTAVENIIKSYVNAQPEHSQHIMYKPEFGPYCVEIQWDGTFADPFQRQGVRRALVSASAPVFLTNDVSVNAVRADIVVELQKAIKTGAFLTAAKKMTK